MLSEVCLAQWKEFDFENLAWNVPPEHLKTGRKHGEVKRIPINKEMDAVLEQAKRIASDTSPDALVFPNRRNEPHQLDVVVHFFRRLMNDPKVNPHGFRRVFRDWMDANNFSDILSEMQACHSLGHRGKCDKLLDQRRILPDGVWQILFAAPTTAVGLR